MVEQYNQMTYEISKLTTRLYSTSFYSAVSWLGKDIRPAIFGIYGFVRFADEIVDTFHEYDKEHLLARFEADYYDALKHGISLNPILNAFQDVVRKYNISDDLVQAFLKSMKFDLHKSTYTTREEIKEYIYGSADVVGLMCLRVFVYGEDKLYEELKGPAMRLGSAFQKVNFLRDLKNDMESLDRKYFPETTGGTFDENIKNTIVRDMQDDFDAARKGIRKLPKSSKLAVLVAYYYYCRLVKEIKRTPAQELITKRVRVPDVIKLLLLIKAQIVCKLGLI